MNRIFILFWIVILIGNRVFAQEEEINVVGYRLLDYARDNLPEDILQTRSAVFVSVPPKARNSSERGDWKTFAKETHNYFMQIGIDPVAYFYIDDILAGPDASRTYADFLVKRGIKHIILLSKVLLSIKNKEVVRYVVAITEFNGQPDFISNGQKAWKDQGKDIENIMKNILRVTVRREYSRTNYLIIDQPEFFEGFSVIENRKSETFPTDLRIDNLAVPKFTDIVIPENAPGGTLNSRIEEEIKTANRNNARQNRDLTRIFEIYPYKFELVDYSRGEEQLYKDGFMYVLLNLHTTGYSIKEMLDYDPDPNETDYITIKRKTDGTVTLRTIPVHAPVYKFYIKQLYTKEVFVGETWDADETWQEALANLLDNVVGKLKSIR